MNRGDFLKEDDERKMPINRMTKTALPAGRMPAGIA